MTQGITSPLIRIEDEDVRLRHSLVPKDEVVSRHMQTRLTEWTMCVFLNRFIDVIPAGNQCLN